MSNYELRTPAKKPWLIISKINGIGGKDHISHE